MRPNPMLESRHAGIRCREQVGLTRNDDRREPGKVSFPRLHGEICGLLCAGWTPVEDGPRASRFPLPEEWGERELDFWLGQGPGLSRQLAGGQLDFALGLPDDEEAIGPRVEALAAWLSGFLSALGEAGPGFPRTDEGREVLRDLVEISRVEPPAVSSESDEADFLEVAEYVRMAIQFLYDERQGLPAPPDARGAPA